jgi:ArsR family transcriptional regulator
MMKRSTDARHAPLALAAQAAKALGHPTRLRLLAMLTRGPLCVCQMTAVVRQATSTVSGHLLELRRAGLVVEERRGKWVEYRLPSDGPFAALVARALDALAADPVAMRDAEIVRGVRAVPLDVLCRARLDLRAAGVRTTTRTRASRRGAQA